MSDPLDRLLQDAAGAMRTDTAKRPKRAASTRARVLESHRRAPASGARAQVWLAAAAALAVVFAGSSAWALWTGRLPWSEPTPAHSPAPEDSSERAPALRPSPPPRAPAPSAVPPPAVELVAPVIEGSPARDTPSAVSSDVEAPARPDLDVVDPAERRAYRQAHSLHFGAQDAAAAEAAWRRYLAAYPHGHFALEARYNRALALVRLGRDEEASAALAPFARGTHGGYRRAEAAALLEALEAD